MRRILALAAASLALSACYHVSVTTGAPASPTVIDKQWQNSFVIGLVPPPEIDTKDKCPQGVSKVETEQTFLNGLVRSITYSIYTPMRAKITCASGPVPR